MATIHHQPVMRKNMTHNFVEPPRRRGFSNHSNQDCRSMGRNKTQKFGHGNDHDRRARSFTNQLIPRHTTVSGALILVNWLIQEHWFTKRFWGGPKIGVPPVIIHFRQVFSIDKPSIIWGTHWWKPPWSSRARMMDADATQWLPQALATAKMAQKRSHNLWQNPTVKISKK